MPKPVKRSVPQPTERKLRAVGITCGIGSMLVGARQAGFDVVGNIEWRRYYHYRDEEGRNTFTENFPGSFMRHNLDEMTPEEESLATGCDIALGHPECGAFSNLRNVKRPVSDDPCDIPLFVDLVARLRPRFFVMDDLPPSFAAFPMSEYVRRLPDYDLFPEWVSNYHYGNVQRHRKRMFMIGSRKDERWTFVPGEDPDIRITLRETIGDICDEDGNPVDGVPNHREHVLDVVCGRALHLNAPGERASWRDVKEYFSRQPFGKIMEYHCPDGSIKVRFGLARTHWDDHCHVITGQNPTIHPISCLPMTIRERARVQGFPDDFVFFGEKLDEEGRWNHDKNNHMVKQTGKAMPVQFCRYVSRQIMAHIQGAVFESSGARVLTSNPYVNEAKKWYCDSIGYSDQVKACRSCWMKESCSIRTERYGIANEDVGAERTPLKIVKVGRTKAESKTVVPSVPRTSITNNVRRSKMKKWNGYRSPDKTIRMGGS